MSEYSTDDLISVVGHYRDGRTPSFSDEECDAIIARLRAADRLLAMMRLIELRTDESGETWFSIFNEGGRSALINVSSHGPIVRGALADFETRRKGAIADYEGKQ